MDIMKKFKYLLFALLMVPATLLFTSCNNLAKPTTSETHGHNYQSKSDSTNHWQECTCGDKKEVESHSFGDWKTIKEPTVNTTGSKERECSSCHYKETETVPVVPHTHQYPTEWTIVNEPTATETGIKKKVCSVCGYELIEEIPVLNLEYTLSADKTSYIVTGLGEVTSRDIVIRDTYNSLPVTGIAKDAFKECDIIKSVVIPASITSIGEDAFRRCFKLAEVYNLSSLNITLGSRDNGYVGNYAKVIHTSLDEQSRYIAKDDYLYIKDNENKYHLIEYTGTAEDLTLPNDVDGNAYEISIHAFFGCESLKNVVIPTSVTTIRDGAFSNCVNLVSIDIPASVTILEKYAFSGCTNLSNVKLPDGITSLGNGTFQNCSSLTSIEIPTSVSSVGFYAFKGCSKLTSITIPDGVTTIEKETFMDCSNLTNIVIPASITSIGEDAFRRCFKLAEVYNLSSLNITLGSRDNGYVGNYAKVIHTSIEEQSRYIAKDDYLYIKDNENKYHLIEYTGTAEDLTLPNDVDGNAYEISIHAFSSCESLKNVVIPTSVTTIRDGAFSNCVNLVSIDIPASVTILEKYAFSGCSKLTSVKLPNGITSIGNGTFQNCSNLTSIEIPTSVSSVGFYAFKGCSKLTSITIPDGVTTIEKETFMDCSSLTNIVIPATVTTIEENILSGCNSLTKVYYKGTVSDWGAISIDNSNDVLSLENIYYYSESKPTDTTNSYWYYDKNKNVCIWE